MKFCAKLQNNSDFREISKNCKLGVISIAAFFWDESMTDILKGIYFPLTHMLISNFANFQVWGWIPVSFGDKKVSLFQFTNICEDKLERHLLFFYRAPIDARASILYHK